MRNLLLTVGIILAFAWAVAYFAFSVVGLVIHLLLAFAVIAVIVAFIPKGNAVNSK